MDRTEKKKTGSQQTFLAWMFCFPTSDHAMMVPPRELFLSNFVLCMCIHVSLCAYFMTKQK